MQRNVRSCAPSSMEDDNPNQCQALYMCHEEQTRARFVTLLWVPVTDAEHARRSCYDSFGVRYNSDNSHHRATSESSSEVVKMWCKALVVPQAEHVFVSDHNPCGRRHCQASEPG
ncbi:hypothetical protein HGRIS_007071 [Hohenbuehelia grisea]|uniref:Uncharacterized protein n=1 Tax=Hohenbuehelia grisea TaxID=104357 RepID=A0ABR3JAX4_9AGAR